jgi:F-type H+-transporting ATPase subunit delta
MVDPARGVARGGLRARPDRKISRKFNGLGLANPGASQGLSSPLSGVLQIVASENVSVSGLSGRYATALFELAQESKSLDAIASDLARLKALLAGSADLARLVRSPVFSRDEQSKAMGAILARLNVGQTTKNFVGLLAQKRRLFVLAGIIQDFDKLLAGHRGEMSADVSSAQALKPAQVTALAGTLKDALKRDIRITQTVDPTLLGGLVVKVGSRQIDSSLKSKLVRLERTMRGA